MSLTSIIYNQAAIREGLSARTVRPVVRLDPIKAPSLTANYRIVGTAFDYLLRFRLQRLNSISQTTRWVAELGVDLIGASEYVYDLDEEVLSPNVDRQRRKADKYINEAQKEHRLYLKSGVATDRLLVAALRLAYLDVAYRAGPDRIDWVGLKKPNSLDVADLRALLTLVDDSSFRARHACLLNPTFGGASRLVGGADADVVVDDVLIDIKTTKAPRLDPRDFYQLIGYYLLLGFDGIQCANSKTVQHQINSLGIYFSRYGYLWKIPVEQVFPQGSIGETAKWFFQSVCTSKSQRLKCGKAFQGALAPFLLSSAERSRKPTKKRRTTKVRKKLMSNRRSHTDARKSRARG